MVQEAEEAMPPTSIVRGGDGRLPFLHPPQIRVSENPLLNRHTQLISKIAVTARRPCSLLEAGKMS